MGGLLLAGGLAFTATTSAATWPGREIELIHVHPELTSIVGAVAFSTIQVGEGGVREAVFVAARRPDPDGGWRLWASDGSVSGTGPVSALSLPGSPDAVWSAESGGVYFRAEGTGGHPAIWFGDRVRGTAIEMVSSPSLPGLQTAVHSVGRHQVWLWSTGEQLRVQSVDPIAGSIEELALPERVSGTAVARTSSFLLFGASGNGFPRGLKAFHAGESSVTSLPPLPPGSAWGQLHMMGAADGFACLKEWYGSPINQSVAVCSDGSAAGTERLVPDDAMAIRVLDYVPFRSLGTRLLFQGYAMVQPGVFGDWRIWSTDGTSAGTVMLFGEVDEEMYNFCSRPRPGEQVVTFTRYGAKPIQEFWVTDGSREGSIQLASHVLDWDDWPVYCTGEGAHIPGAGALVRLQGRSGLFRVSSVTSAPLPLASGPSTAYLVVRVGDVIVLLGPNGEGQAAFWRYIPDRVFAHGFD